MTRLLILTTGLIIGACAGIGVLVVWCWYVTEGKYR